MGRERTIAKCAARASAFIGLAALGVAVTAFAGAASVGVQDIIVDNRDGNVRRVGDWFESAASGEYEQSSEYANPSKNVPNGSEFFWYPVLPMDGNYDVYVWYTWHPNRAASVPFELCNGSDCNQKIVDQTNSSNAGRWFLLWEDYPLRQAESLSIEVSSENGQASADAVKLTKVGGPPGGRLPIDCEEGAIAQFVGGEWVCGPDPMTEEIVAAVCALAPGAELCMLTQPLSCRCWAGKTGQEVARELNAGNVVTPVCGVDLTVVQAVDTSDVVPQLRVVDFVPNDSYQCIYSINTANEKNELLSPEEGLTCLNEAKAIFPKISWCPTD